MKNYILISVFTLISGVVFAQSAEKLDTIYANDQKNVALFFPTPIVQGITGAGHFAFTYNREKQQHFGLLQAKPGKESNLLVIDARGSVYSYILKYKKQLSRLNYFIPEPERIGKEKPKGIDSTKVAKPEKEIAPNKTYYRRFSSYLLSKNQRIGRIKKRKQGIVLSIENIVFNKEELYFVIQIENRSSLDYDLNFLNLSIQTRQKGKKKSLQTLQQEPIYQYKVLAKLRKKQSLKMIYVFPKFSISKDRRALLELNEKDGERNVSLKISHRFINNPN